MDLKIGEYLKNPDGTMTHAVTLARNEAEVDTSLETACGIAFIDQVRGVRAMIIRTFMEPEQVNTLYPRQQDVVTSKLSTEEIDNLIHLVITASSLVGCVYLENDELSRRKLAKQLQMVLDKIREKTKNIKWGHKYSIYANDQALFLPSQWIAKYRSHNLPDTDDLGKLFKQPIAHPYLEGISLADIKKRLKSGYDILVLAPAASSGVLQAAVLAEYLKRDHGILATVDPVFFGKGEVGDNDRLRYMTHVLPNLGRKLNPLVLPFDDDVVLTGDSARQTAISAANKYGQGSIIMSDNFKPLLKTR